MERRADAATGKRPIRSFVRREGRLTAGQQRALELLWPAFGLERPPAGQPLDLDRAFGRRAPRILEIGFGNGESLAEQAAAHPERDYLGIEVHRPGVGHLLMEVEKRHLGNVRVMMADAAEVLVHHIADESLHGVQLFFPDPWPKKRHHKRRLVQPQWVRAVAAKLAPGGFLHLATDWADYAEHMLDVLEADPDLENTCGPRQFSPRGERPGTKFERRGLRKGHQVFDLYYRKREHPG
ncbi:tRNA (guanosine(46)-N7)-methyltransferase TrmB [Alkalilimnicola ehrlichii]|uniref:tRNA (guanosine(46)-N7)-methyltransferase TrmB n=1 Tax=Alkalilimnicola ehrlichii TaxID=351052 RepID=UPI003B9EE2B7